MNENNADTSNSNSRSSGGSTMRVPPPRTRSRGFGIAPRRLPPPPEEEQPPRKRLSRSDDSPLQPRRRPRESSPVTAAMDTGEPSATTTSLREDDDEQPERPSINVPRSLMNAIQAVTRLVPRSRQGRDALDALRDQLRNLRVALRLEPRLTLYAPVDATRAAGGGVDWHAEDEDDDDDDDRRMADPHDAAAGILPVGVGMTCATYPANAPSEDRYTVVLGTDFCFAGVWDGHGGTLCSEYVSRHVFRNFQHAVLTGSGSVARAFVEAYRKTDEGYLEHARSQTGRDRGALFAGACAVACHVDFRDRTVTCANLGDGRAVMAVVNDGRLTAVRPLSTDHTTDNPAERRRMRDEHPHDPHLIVNMEPDEDEAPDWRVKGIAAFTRSLGDTQLKDKASAAVYNSYVPPHRRILPRPGIRPRPDAPHKTRPYLSNEPETQTQPLSEGFIIIACDGVWDEMTSEEAVQVVYDLIVRDADANLADLFIEQVLQRAVQRLRETDPDEADVTLEELKRRPQGKASDSHRSNLHDDITVVILQFNGIEGHTRTSTSSSSSFVASPFEYDAAAASPREAPTERRVWNTESNLSVFSRDSLWSHGSEHDDDDEEMESSSARPLPSARRGGVTASYSMDLSRDFHVMSDLLTMQDSWNELTMDDVGELLAKLGKRVSDDKLQEIFGKLDVNGTGTVPMRDFQTWWAVKKRRHAATKHRKRAVTYNEGLTALEESVDDDENRQQSTHDQIMGMIQVFGGMTARHLRILYDVLDADGSGELETDEINFLLRKVLGEDPTESLVETTFNEMDEDGSGAIGFSEFCNFFGVYEDEEP